MFDVCAQTSCLYRFFSVGEAQRILVQSAERAEAEGWHSDSIRLQQFAEQYERVAMLCAKRLSRVVSAPAHHSERIEMVQLTRQFLSFLSTSQELIRQTPKKPFSSVPASPFQSGADSASGAGAGRTVSTEKLAALHTLLKLVQFFDLYRSGPDHADDAIRVCALRLCAPSLCVLCDVLFVLSAAACDACAASCVRVQAMEQLSLIPSSSAEESEAVTRFSRQDDSVKRLLADISVALMEIFTQQYKSIKEQKITARDPARQKVQYLAALLLRRVPCAVYARRSLSVAW
jgi:hypothetical protein